jgi:anaerobic selenocysteine-containing dehydrogenase
MSNEWQQSACILCECNCGIEVQLGGEGGRHIVRTRGDAAHPASQGYLCQKASRLDHYQNGPDRVTQPLRRRVDGSFEAIDWDTAIREVAERFARLRDAHGGSTILYYGGGGQGNHLPGAYASATRRALGMRYRSNALAQEKTGEFWVNGRLFGNGVRADFEHCEVAVFLGKNPWQSHGIPRARITLREIARDPARTLIVIDPVRTETAELADIHLQPRPGTDAWLLAAMLGMLWQEDLVARDWLGAHASGLEQLEPRLAGIDIARCLAACGVEEAAVRAATRRIAGAASVAFCEDLGVQMNRHSTLVSYLEKLVWLLTGNFAKTGAQYIPSAIQSLFGSGGSGSRSPVVGAPIISGLVPCNVIADEILCDHPERYRGMLVESANPAHSLAESARIREALAHLEMLVVIDVAMTETARLAHYVLPSATQYEKWEATFFNFEHPRNYFHLRQPLFTAPAGVLPEAEIHARLVEALGAMPTRTVERLRAAATNGRAAFREAFFTALAEDRALAGIAPVVLYRTLGESLPEGAAAAAVLWAPLQMFAAREPEALARAGFAGAEAGEQLFDAVLAGHSGVVFAVDEVDSSWQRMATADGRVQLAIPELLEAWAALDAIVPVRDDEYPLVLAAGERRDYTANTINRDPDWRRKGRDGALRVSAADAAAIGLGDGAAARLRTRGGEALVRIEISARMQPGHIALPNGLGLDNAAADGALQRTGVAVNELTRLEDRDAFAGTPWHKFVPARLEVP